MKNVLLVSSIFLLSACSMTNDMTRSSSTKDVFKCSDESTVTASYSADGEKAYLNINMPKVKLVDQPLTLTQAVSGSGMRFVNTENPTYEWQTKANEGVMSITWSNEKEYSVSCYK